MESTDENWMPVFEIIQERGLDPRLVEPCGEPAVVSDLAPSSMTPARSHLRIKRRMR